MASNGLGADGYRAKLMQFVQELITASGKTADSTACVGQMLYDAGGFCAFFDPHDNLRVEAVTQALAKVLPPDQVAASEGDSNWYGFGSQAEFLKLDPMTRMKLVEQAKHDAATAAKKSHQAEADALARASLPADFSTWSPERRLTHANKIAHDAEVARRARAAR